MVTRLHQSEIDAQPDSGTLFLPMIRSAVSQIEFVRHFTESDPRAKIAALETICIFASEASSRIKAMEDVGSGQEQSGSSVADELLERVARLESTVEQLVDRSYALGFMSATDIAQKLGVIDDPGYDALHQWLSRWRAKNLDGWVQVADPKHHQPRFLYYSSQIWPAIKNRQLT